MVDETTATIVTHADDWARASMVSKGLIHFLPNARIQILDVEGRDQMEPWGLGTIIVLATPNLVASSDFHSLLGMLDPAGTDHRRVLATLDVDLPAPNPRTWVTVDLSRWNGSPASEELRSIAGIVSAGDFISDGMSAEDRRAAALMTLIEDIPFMPRTKTILRNQNMIRVGDLVGHTEAEMLRLPDFGRKSLRDVKDRLAEIELRLGMDPIGWPLADIEDEAFRLAHARRVARLQQTPGGAFFEPDGERFAMRVAGGLDDDAAARRPMTQQMQTAALDKARTFAGLASRLDNQTGWTGIARAATTVVELLDRDPVDVPDVLGLIYPAVLELGSFFDLDQRLSTGADSNALPLDPEVRRPLEDLLRTAAPWLRAFPSIREADDEASRFLVEVTSLQPTVEVVTSARDLALLTSDDLEVFRQLRDAAARGAFQGGKAGGRAKRSAVNLVISIAAFTGGLLIDATVSDYATTSPLAHKAGQFLTSTEKAIESLIEDMPSDLRHAIGGFTRAMAEHPILPSEPRQPSRPDRQELVGRRKDDRD